MSSSACLPRLGCRNSPPPLTLDPIRADHLHQGVSRMPWLPAIDLDLWEEAILTPGGRAIPLLAAFIMITIIWIGEMRPTRAELRLSMLRS